MRCRRFLLPRLVKRVLVTWLAELTLLIRLVLWLAELRLLVRLVRLAELALRVTRLAELVRLVVPRNVQLLAELHDRQYAEHDDRQSNDDCQEDREFRSAVQGDVRCEPVITAGGLGFLQFVLCRATERRFSQLLSQYDNDPC